MNIGNIIQGHYYELIGKNKHLRDERLYICLECPLYSDRLGGVCNHNLWLNPTSGDVSTEEKEGYYRGCGCRINSKTRLTNEKCPAGKW